MNKTIVVSFLRVDLRRFLSEKSDQYLQRILRTLKNTPDHKDARCKLTIIAPLLRKEEVTFDEVRRELIQQSSVGGVKEMPSDQILNDAWTIIESYATRGGHGVLQPAGQTVEVPQ